MGLLFKPQTVSVFAIVETYDSNGNVTAPPIYPVGISVKGMLTPYTGVNAKFDNKSGIQLTNPHIFYCNITDLPSFQYGYRVVYGKRTFTITESPSNWNVGGVASPAQHGTVVMEELELA